MGNDLKVFSLQRLRVSEGWWVQINKLYEVDPDWSINHVDDCFDEDMYYAEHRSKMLAIDIGWHWPPGEKNKGKYCLQLMNLKKVDKHNKVYYEADFENPIEKVITLKRNDLVEKLEEYLSAGFQVS